MTMAFLSALLFIGCATSNTGPRIHKVSVSTSDAPEVHGLNGNTNPHSAMMRINGKMNFSKHKDVNVKTKKKYDVWYEMGGVEFVGKMDALYKINHFALGGGFGIDDGLFYHFTSEWNFSHFEVGSFVGLFHQADEIKYSEEKCESVKQRDIGIDGLVFWSEEYCSSYTPYEDEKTEFSLDPFLGVFVGAFIDKFFVNYSLSLYFRQIKVEDKSIDIPYVMSHYFNLGYRFHELFDVSIGTVLTQTDSKKSELLYGFNGSVSYFIL